MCMLHFSAQSFATVWEPVIDRLIQMDSSETDFGIVYLFGTPNQAKNIDVS